MAANQARSISGPRVIGQGMILDGQSVLDRTPPPAGPMFRRPLDEYCREGAIGGLGAFGPAVRRKIIRETAGLSGPAIGYA